MIDLFRPFMSQKARDMAYQTLTPTDDGRLYIGQGLKVQEFEKEFGALVGQETPLPLTTNSCTSALDLALHLIGVGIGDEVITTPMTCTATNSPPVNRRAKLVWADIDPKTGNLTAETIKARITDRTKAIMCVDWAGRSCDYAAIRQIAFHANGDRIPIIQDAAHNLLGVDPVHHGDYVAWSFQAIKHLNTVDGGALLVPQKQYDRAKLLRWYGLDRESSTDFRCEQDIREVGYKYHMHDVAASLGLGNLPDMPRIVAKARQNALWLNNALKGIPGLVTPRDERNHSWWLYTVIVDDQAKFISHMKENGVFAGQVHARNDKHSAFDYYSGPLVGVDYFDSHQVAIPNGWWLSQADLEKVAATVVSYAQLPVAA